ncbi:hypothetical protein PFFVO_02247 [Plasmodium falciparum Vietnam Oak-Knoll (FVO)]|uniref:Uncharacterized protein n=1 Tax=Plasmodium falciparum Vietnam Oak-Knoll (FVO) TaxID=1036723 RepID=A0A024V9H1_PLAFA|nr:hypothetical protein PFFVO_02247 [Plasmodium falciparum Vietnam Oak-Knoll (FVO)]
MLIHQTKIFNSDDLKYVRIDYTPRIPSPQYICQKKYTYNEKEEIFKKEKIITYKNCDPKKYSNANDIKKKGNIKIYKSKDIYKNVDNNQNYVYKQEKIITKRKYTNPKDEIGKNKKKMTFSKGSTERILLIKHNKKDVKKECVQKENIKIINKNNNDNMKKNKKLHSPFIINDKTKNLYFKNEKLIISQKIKEQEKKIKPTEIINNSSYLKLGKKNHTIQTKEHYNREKIKDISYADIKKKDKLKKMRIIKEQEHINNYTFESEKKRIETNNTPSIKNKQNIDNKNKMKKVIHTDLIKLYPIQNIKEKSQINNTLNREKTKKYQALKNNIKKIKAQINKQNDIYKNIFISTQINKNNQTSTYINKKVNVKNKKIINNDNDKIKYRMLTQYAKPILSSNNISNKNEYVNEEKKKMNKKIKMLATRKKNNNINIKVNKIKNKKTDTCNHYLDEGPNIIKSQESILYDLINQKKNKDKIKKFLQNSDKPNNISQLKIQEKEKKKKKIKKSHKRKFIHLYISSQDNIKVESNKKNSKDKDSNHNEPIVQLKKKKRKIQTNKPNETIDRIIKKKDNSTIKCIVQKICQSNTYNNNNNNKKKDMHINIKKKENSNHILFYDHNNMSCNHKIKNIIYPEYTNQKQDTTYYHNIKDKYQAYKKENQNGGECIKYKNIHTNNDKKENIVFHINKQNEQIYEKNTNMNKYNNVDCSAYQQKRVDVKSTRVTHKSNNIITSDNNIKQDEKKLKSLNVYKIIHNINKETTYNIASNIKANISHIYEKNKTYNKHINNYKEYKKIDPISFNNTIQPNNLEKKNASSNISKCRYLYKHIYMNKDNQKIEGNNVNINKNINMNNMNNINSINSINSINYINEKQKLYYKMVSEKHKGIKNEFIELEPKNKKNKNKNKINKIIKDKRKVYTPIKKIIKKKYIFIYDKTKIFTRKKHHSIIIIVNKFKIKEHNLLLFLNKTKLNKYIPKVENNTDIQNNTILNKDNLYIPCIKYGKYISWIQKMCYLYFLIQIMKKNKMEQNKKGLNNYISIQKRQKEKKKKKYL